MPDMTDRVLTGADGEESLAEEAVRRGAAPELHAERPVCRPHVPLAHQRQRERHVRRHECPERSDPAAQNEGATSKLR